MPWIQSYRRIFVIFIVIVCLPIALQSTRSHWDLIIIYQIKCMISCRWWSLIFRHTVPPPLDHACSTLEDTKCLALSPTACLTDTYPWFGCHQGQLLLLMFLIICKTGYSQSSMPLPNWFSQEVFNHITALLCELSFFSPWVNQW